jgi:hypothetical protein
MKVASGSNITSKSSAAYSQVGFGRKHFFGRMLEEELHLSTAGVVLLF